jgi:hypothetical protein
VVLEAIKLNGGLEMQAGSWKGHWNESQEIPSPKHTQADNQ